MEPFVGELRWVAYPFAPKGWAFCNGQLLPISQNQALFSLLGVTYGGNGTTTFALPDYRGRVPNHFGSGAGQQLPIGAVGGEERHTLTVPEIPAHTHLAQASTAAGTVASPEGALWAVPPKPAYATDASSVALAAGAIDATGGSQAHENRPPTLTLNAIIALVGIFPSRQ